MMGGMLVVVADLLGRVLFAPLELPCGIITAAIGAPYFVYLHQLVINLTNRDVWIDIINWNTTEIAVRVGSWKF